MSKFMVYEIIDLPMLTFTMEKVLEDVLVEYTCVRFTVYVLTHVVYVASVQTLIPSSNSLHRKRWFRSSYVHIRTQYTYTIHLVCIAKTEVGPRSCIVLASIKMTISGTRTGTDHLQATQQNRLSVTQQRLMQVHSSKSIFELLPGFEIAYSSY